MSQLIHSNRTDEVNYDILEDALKSKSLIHNFEPTGGAVVEYCEMSFDDNRSRSIKGHTETNTWTVTTTVYGNTEVTEFESVERAVTHIAHNYLGDIGRGVVESFELGTAGEDFIDEDTVRGLLSRVSKGQGAKDSVIKAVNYISGLKPREEYNSHSVFTTQDEIEAEHPEKIFYDVGAGKFNDVKGTHRYNEIKTTLEICLTLNLVESVKVKIEQEETTFVVQV